MLFVPTVMGTYFAYSTDSSSISGMRERRRAGSSSLIGTGRPEGRPMKARVVAPGHTTAMPSPIPRDPLEKARFEALAEGEEEDDRERAPGDGEDGEDDPLRLVAEVGAEEAPDESELGDREPHESLSATTGSRSDARRAGK